MLKRAVGEEKRLKLGKELAARGRCLILTGPLFLLYLTDGQTASCPNIAVTVISLNVLDVGKNKPNHDTLIRGHFTFLLSVQQPLLVSSRNGCDGPNKGCGEKMFHSAAEWTRTK